MGSCSSCNKTANQYNRSPRYNASLAQRVAPENCNVGSEQLINWRTILKCLKNTNKGEIVGLSTQQINVFLGIVQSAINYPDDYCHYQSKFVIFQEQYLPLIISDVPECI